MCSPWQSKLKLNYMKNPSFGELRSLCQINQVCKEENQRRNLAFNNFATPCEIFTSLRIAQEEYKPCEAENKEFRKPCETMNEFCNPLRNFCKPCETEENEFRNPLRNLPVIFRYFFTDSIIFLSQDILCNYLFSPYNQLKIFLDI